MFPSAFTGRAVPSGRCQLHGPSRSDVSPAWAPTLRPVRPCGFLRLASRFLSLRALRRRPRGSFVGDVFRPRTGPATRAVIATWPGVSPSGDAPGIYHSLRSVDPTRGRSRLIGMTGPTCRFAVHPPRVSSSRGLVSKDGPWISRPRLLGFASLPQVSRAVSSADPAMAFMHRVVRTHRPGLPWDFRFLSQVFGVAPPVSTSEDPSARASRAATRDVAAAMNVAKRRPCPSALSGAVA